MGEIGWTLFWIMLLFVALILVVTLPDMSRAIERRWPKQSFRNLQGGVYIREPNGSEHVIQNFIEQFLNERGMRMSTLQRAPVEDLVNDGIWENSIASGNRIDVAIIGRIITRPCQLNVLKQKRFPDEKEQYETVPGTSYTLDVRFYGPGAQILGGYADTWSTAGHFKIAMDYLADGLTQKLKLTFRPKIGQSKSLVKN